MDDRTLTEGLGGQSSVQTSNRVNDSYLNETSVVEHKSLLIEAPKTQLNWERLLRELEQPMNMNLEEHLKLLLASGYNLVELCDSKKFTLLHHAALKE
jgi:predicted GNAT superfamily acetyltransferase